MWWHMHGCLKFPPESLSQKLKCVMMRNVSIGYPWFPLTRHPLSEIDPVNNIYLFICIYMYLLFFDIFSYPINPHHTMIVKKIIHDPLISPLHCQGHQSWYYDISGPWSMVCGKFSLGEHLQLRWFLARLFRPSLCRCVQCFAVNCQSIPPPALPISQLGHQDRWVPRHHHLGWLPRSPQPVPPFASHLVWARL